MIDFTDPVNLITFVFVVCFLGFLFYYHDNTMSIRDLREKNKSLEEDNDFLLATLNKHLPYWRDIAHKNK